MVKFVNDTNNFIKRNYSCLPLKHKAVIEYKNDTK